jgi:uncharacterized membrane protein YkvA (DUF1232 family)
MKVSFELSPRDIRYFREQLQKARKGDSPREEHRVIRGTIQMVEDAAASKPPEFVLERIAKLKLLIDMLRDDEWRLEGRDRERILDALAYFVEPDDLIPDKVPGIGYLDDAIMIELVVRELTHEIEAYNDFCAFRKQQPKKEEPARLETRRDALQARMRRRRHRERGSRRSGTKASRSPLNLW